jgi:hypothetical protein
MHLRIDQLLLEVIQQNFHKLTHLLVHRLCQTLLAKLSQIDSFAKHSQTTACTNIVNPNRNIVTKYYDALPLKHKIDLSLDETLLTLWRKYGWSSIVRSTRGNCDTHNNKILRCRLFGQREFVYSSIFCWQTSHTFSLGVSRRLTWPDNLWINQSLFHTCTCLACVAPFSTLTPQTTLSYQFSTIPNLPLLPSQTQVHLGMPILLMSFLVCPHREIPYCVQQIKLKDSSCQVPFNAHWKHFSAPKRISKARLLAFSSVITKLLQITVYQTHQLLVRVLIRTPMWYKVRAVEAHCGSSFGASGYNSLVTMRVVETQELWRLKSRGDSG